MIKVLLAVLLMILLTTIPALGAEWSVGWGGGDVRFQQLDMAGDKDYQFIMDRFICKASKVFIDGIKNEVFERRTVACQVSKETYVSTDLSFNTNGNICTSTRSLTISDKDKNYIVSLFVRCK